MRYSNLKKLAAVVLSIGMVFSSSAVTGFSADNSKMIPTIAESSYSQAAAVMDEEYAYDEHMLITGGIRVRVVSLE